MIKRLLYTTLILTAFVFSKSSYAQDPHFSQFYANPVYLNPAFAGSAVCPRLILNYRNQWPSIPGAFVTYTASYDQHFEKISGGVALLIMNDKAGEGALNNLRISGVYSYKLDVTRKFKIRAALEATYHQKSLDWNKLRFGDQIDPQWGFVINTQEPRPSDGELNNGFVDFSTGILGYSESFYAGVAIHHLTEPEEGFVSISTLPMRLTAHVGTTIDLTRTHSKGRTLQDATLSPNLLYMQQLNFHQLNYGCYFNKYPFVGGIWYRQNFNNSDAIIFLAGLQQPTFKFGYSYDLTVSQLTNVTGGAHEISFAWQFKCPPVRKKIKAIICPSF